MPRQSGGGASSHPAVGDSVTTTGVFLPRETLATLVFYYDWRGVGGNAAATVLLVEGAAGMRAVFDGVFGVWGAEKGWECVCGREWLQLVRIVEVFMAPVQYSSLVVATTTACGSRRSVYVPGLLQDGAWRLSRDQEGWGLKQASNISSGAGVDIPSSHL